jgi:hypothetical protein
MSDIKEKVLEKAAEMLLKKVLVKGNMEMTFDKVTWEGMKMSITWEGEKEVEREPSKD